MPHTPAADHTTRGEFETITSIAAGAFGNESVITGIGDDAAVTRLSPGMQLLTSTDMLLENVHFRCSWHDAYRLGRKSLAVSISDIAAMGAKPRWTLLSLAIPAHISAAYIDRFIAGFHSMAREFHVALIGGDTCASRSDFAVSVTIMGEQLPHLIVRRSGARPGDDIWVTGTLGAAAIALAGVENSVAVPEVLLTRLLDPVPRIAAGRALAEAGLVTAMIDVSDGVCADFAHICTQSGVGGELYRDALPLAAETLPLATALSHSAHDLALNGGEDYELCFTARAVERKNIAFCMKKCGIAATRIGIVTRFPGVTVRNRDGSIHTLKHNGFTHFPY